MKPIVAARVLFWVRFSENVIQISERAVQIIQRLSEGFRSHLIFSFGLVLTKVPLRDRRQIFLVSSVFSLGTVNKHRGRTAANLLSYVLSARSCRKGVTFTDGAKRRSLGVSLEL